MTTTTPLPVYFVSHGGPNLLDESDYPPTSAISKALRKIGDDIRAQNPRALLVLSGHWESNSGKSLQINGKSAFPKPLIYDFGGFPAWLYKEEFAHKTEPALTQQIAQLLTQGGIPVETVDRGLDHGAWVVLKKAGLESAPFPIIQLSLFRNDSMPQHVHLGQLLAPLREQGVVIVGSGMAVHNLRDYFGASATSVRSYVRPFDKEIETALLSGENREQAILALSESDYLYKAHPTLEHLLPLHVAVGAAKGTANVEKILEAYQVSLSWSCYKFF
ncbi:hypothetical protein LPJ66_001567 [Kickxella alabastrina]|uniref:Uncharacterized protein n=1 Tax=Kickxella alabastrina TaxID=61397 RepID=A0ACC1IT85_9FUNG|nr:hypothetical protein LPJ66_001567 [Kickxella alabastrina]